MDIEQRRKLSATIEETMSFERMLVVGIVMLIVLLIGSQYWLVISPAKIVADPEVAKAIAQATATTLERFSTFTSMLIGALVAVLQSMTRSKAPAGNGNNELPKV